MQTIARCRDPWPYLVQGLADAVVKERVDAAGGIVNTGQLGNLLGRRNPPVATGRVGHLRGVRGRRAEEARGW